MVTQQQASCSVKTPEDRAPWGLGQDFLLVCHFLLQGISLTQRSKNSGPLIAQTFYCQSHQGSPFQLYIYIYDGYSSFGFKKKGFEAADLNIESE